MIENMNFSNVLILYNEDFYKEIDLDGFEKDTIVIGNTDTCDIKLKLRVKEPASIKFNKKNAAWQVEDGEKAYSVVNGIKAPRRILTNGDQLTIKESTDKKELFKINYFIDFIVEKENYDLVVSLEDIDKLTIGSDSDNNIIIEDDLVSKFHAEITKDGNNQFFVCDLKSKFGVHLNGRKVEAREYLKDNDFIIICGYKFLFKDNSIAMSKLNEKLIINGLEARENNYIVSSLEYPCFYRSPRFLKEIQCEDVDIEAPPEKAKNSSNMIIIGLIPIIGTMMLTMTMSASQNKTQMIYSVGMVALTAVTTVLTYVFQIINTKKEQFKRYKRYLEYIKEKEELIKEKRDVLISNLKELNPNSQECYEYVETFSRRLWEKSPEHEDFLKVSIGTGTLPINFKINIPNEKFDIDKERLKDTPKKLKERYNEIDDIPICLSLTENFPIGVYGNRPYVIEFMKNLVTNIATLHYYEDVKLVVVYPEDENEHWQWMKWLPHIWGYNKEIRFVGNSKETVHNVLNYLYDLVRERECRKDEDSPRYFPHYVVIIADNTLVENEPIMSMLESQKDYGITSIFVYDYIGFIPKECRTLIEVINNENTKLLDVKTDNSTDVTFSELDVWDYEKLSKRMAPIYVKSSFVENSLTSYITLFDLYDITSIKELNILEQWNNSRVYETMAVPLGVKIGDEKVYLNLHEKFHGPHGLVAGTTGSGKSEILQSYIASLAINYHPYDVALILIDYKGGGMANQFKDLPHLVGTITNLDGNQINRALISIKSELKRRQKIFAENNVNHIDAYIKLYKKGSVKEPIPHLILIADEFAELKSDQPEFMAELVSTARIGRSLGVHLILATQKPAGVVDNQIWSNSKFKLCLKVQNTEDSNEVIKSPLAASIVEPGRAYFQVGNNEIFELFQSAWSGAKRYDDDDVNKRDIEISEVSIDGARTVIYSSKNENKNREGKTELDIVIEELDKIARKNNIARLQGPWLPPLKDIMYLTDIVGAFDKESYGEYNGSISPTIGVLDDPEKQIQIPLKLELSENGHLLIIGSPGVGKTTLIQTIVTSIITSYTPEEANIYILDFGTRTLKIFQEAPHIGGILTSDDDELINNFMKFVRKEINKRKVLLSSKGVSSILAYKEATGKVLPQMLIFIDNFSAFMELYPDFEEEIIVFSREGSNLGISLIITASNSTEVRYKISSNFKLNLTLNCVDKSEYMNVLGRTYIEPANCAGRGLIKTDGIYEFQTALPIDGTTEGERANKLKGLLTTVNEAWNGKKAVPIPQVPKELDLQQLLSNSGEEGYRIPVGIDVNEIETINIDIIENPMITIVGPSKSGKTNFIKSLAYSINKFIPGDLDLYLFESSQYGLLGIDELSSVKLYTSSGEEITNALFEIKEELETRKDMVNRLIIENKGKVKEKDLVANLSRIVLVIDDISDFAFNLNDNFELVDIMSDIVTKYKNLGISIIIAGEEDKFIDNSYSYNFINSLKGECFGILFGDIEMQRFYDIKLKYGQAQKPMQLGDAFYITKDEYCRIRVPYFN